MNREKEIEELLRSALAIAERNGDDTAWDRFADSIRALGIGSVAARTYRVLSSDKQHNSESNGVSLIASERGRQIEQEGWTADHDDQHADGELAIAAACYALAEHARSYGRHNVDELPVKWPWHEGWWKPTPDDRIRELAKAGALIAAEIDRIKGAQK